MKEKVGLGGLGANFSILLGGHAIFSVHRNEMNVHVLEGGDRLGVYERLKKGSGSQFNSLRELFGVDWLGLNQLRRFQVQSMLISTAFRTRIRVKVGVREEKLERESLVGLYPAANWYEREVFDLFGVYFVGHGDLRRILTDYGFIGYPLRKDFPVRGYQEVRYREGLKRVVSEDVELRQDYRVVQN